MPVFVEHAEGAPADRRRRQHLHRLRRRHRLPQRRATRNPRVTAAVQEQAAQRFLHTDFTIVPYESLRRARRAAPARACRSPARRSAAFFNSGAEAVENAVKIARAATGRAGRHRLRGRVPRPHAHGDVADLEGAARTRRASGPFAPEVYRVAFPYAYRWLGAGDAAADRARRPAARAHDARRPGVGGRDHHRARAGRGRLRPGRPPRTCTACASSATSTASC